MSTNVDVTPVPHFADSRSTAQRTPSDLIQVQEVAAPTRALIGAALAVGAIFGFGGNFLPPSPQIVAHALSSIGLVVGCVTLALTFVQSNRVLVAAGLLAFAVSEIGMWNNGPHGDLSASAVASAFLFSAPALLLISIPRGLPIWSRVAGALAAIPFAAHAFQFMLGYPMSDPSPYAIVGYILLTVAVIGWSVAVVRPVTSRGAA